jgi:hypothetical protein
VSVAGKIERRRMAIAEGFRRLGWKGIDEAVLRVRQIDAKVMQPDLLVRDITIRLAKIRPRARGDTSMARTSRRRAEWPADMLAQSGSRRKIPPRRRPGILGYDI